MCVCECWGGQAWMQSRREVGMEDTGMGVEGGGVIDGLQQGHKLV